MTGIRRIDAHQHFWRYRPDTHGWVDDSMSMLRRDFLPEDLAPLLEANAFDASLAVQAQQNTGETRWLLDLADQCPFIAGVVGWVDLLAADARALIEEIAAHPKLVGVREIVQTEPDGFMERADFRRGISALAEFELTYDILIFQRQLPEAEDLVRAFPSQTFVLDHIAKPDICAHTAGDRASFDAWAAGIRTLAAHANVYCKLSGMVTEAEWSSWTAATFHPYLDVVMEAFGSERCMIGSDWPVCTLAGSYGAVISIVLDYVNRLSDSERDAVLGGTAAAAYGLA